MKSRKPNLCLCAAIAIGMGIKRLDSRLRSLLRSQTIISSPADAIRELVHNSIDAKASSITVCLNLATLSFSVSDNGQGLTPDDLSQAGNPFSTSKLSDLQNVDLVRTFGFRGEAVHSLAAISHLTMTSRHVDYNSTYSIKINYGKRLFSSPAIVSSTHHSKLEAHGTVVNLRNLFACTPVRRLQIEKLRDKGKLLEEIKRQLVLILLVRPEIDLKVLLITSSEKQQFIGFSEQSNSNTPTELLLLRHIYGLDLSSNYEPICAKYGSISVSGFIGFEPVQTKKFQFIFINDRLYDSSNTLKEIDNIFINSDFSCNNLSVGKPFSSHPVLIFKITTPVSRSDILQHPSKTIFKSEFEDAIRIILLKLCRSFLSVNSYSEGKSKRTLSLHSNVNQKIKGTNTDNDKLPMSISSGHMMKSHARMGKVDQSELKGRTFSENLLHEHDSIAAVRVATNFNYQPPSQPLSLCSSTSRALNIIPEHFKKHGCQPIKDREIKKTKLSDPDLITSAFFTPKQYELNFKLSKSHLIDCTVIGQVDKKFILITSGTLLIVLDQHACDERVRVEQLLKQHVMNAVDNYHSGASSGDLMNPSLNLYFPSDITNLLILPQYQKEFRFWNIIYNVNSTGNIQITHLPLLVKEKLVSDSTFLQKGISQHIYDLCERQILPFKPPVVKNQVSDFVWWNGVTCIPSFLLNTINSKACRQSIMFGDILTKRECELLIGQLKHCRLPFVCAHGRPSVVPLTDFGEINCYR